MTKKKDITSLLGKDYKSINPKKEPLTIEKFRELTGYHDMSDEDAKEAVFAIRQLCHIAMEIVEEQHLHPPEFFEDRRDKTLGLGKYAPKKRVKKTKPNP